MTKFRLLSPVVLGVILLGSFFVIAKSRSDEK